MADPKAERVSSSMDQVSTAAERTLPREVAAIIGQLGNIEQAKLDQAKKLSPEYNQLSLDLAQKYLKPLQQASADAAIGTDVQMAQQYAPQLANIQKKYEQQSDPATYAAKQQAATKLGELLGSINLGDANPEAERLVSQENLRSGTDSQSSATNTVSNALSFGNELQKRRNALGNALGVATNYLQSSRSAFNPLSITSGRGDTSQYAGTSKAGGEAFALGQGAWDQSSGMKQQANQINANRESLLDKMNQTTSAIGSVVSS